MIQSPGGPEAVRHGEAKMLTHPRANVRDVGNHLDAVLAQVFGRADPGELQNLGRENGAGG